MKAFNFSLFDQNSKLYKLSDYLGKWVVVYFYPKDDTPGCTKEACTFRDLSAEYKKRKVMIFGISKDSIESHKRFAEKYHLNFPILSDEEKKVIKEYQAWGEKKFMGRTFEGVLRKTYLIDPKGEIVKIYEKVNPLFHGDEILKDLDQLIK